MFILYTLFYQVRSTFLHFWLWLQRSYLRSFRNRNNVNLQIIFKPSSLHQKSLRYNLFDQLRPFLLSWLDLRDHFWGHLGQSKTETRFIIFITWPYKSFWVHWGHSKAKKRFLSNPRCVGIWFSIILLVHIKVDISSPK